MRRRNSDAFTNASPAFRVAASASTFASLDAPFPAMISTRTSRVMNVVATRPG